MKNILFFGKKKNALFWLKATKYYTYWQVIYLKQDKQINYYTKFYLILNKTPLLLHKLLY